MQTGGPGREKREVGKHSSRNGGRGRWVGGYYLAAAAAMPYSAAAAAMWQMMRTAIGPRQTRSQWQQGNQSWMDSCTRCAIGGCRLPSRVLNVSRRLGCLHGTAQFLTCPDEDALDRAQEDPGDEADALSTRRRDLFCPSSSRTSDSILRYPAIL